MQDWKTTILLSLIFAALLLAVILPMRTQLPQPYTIFTPYAYPVVPGTSEWGALRGHVPKMRACYVPDELVGQMSTDALLETFLTHPLADELFLHDSYHNGFLFLKDAYHIGLAELMEREDLDEAVLKKYREIPICTVEPPDDMSVDLLYQTYQKEFDDIWRIDLLEVIAAEIDDDHRSIALMNAILDSYAARAKNPRIYQKYTQELVYNRAFVRTWAEKHYTPTSPTCRPLYPLVTIP